MIYVYDDNHDDCDDDDADGGLKRHHLHHGHAACFLTFYGEIEDWQQWYTACPDFRFQFQMKREPVT